VPSWEFQYYIDISPAIDFRCTTRISHRCEQAERKKGASVGGAAREHDLRGERKSISHLRLEKFERCGGHGSGDSDVLEGN